MRVVMKMVIESDDARVLAERELLRLDRCTDFVPEQTGLGLTMHEAKAAIAAAQKELIAAQVEQIAMRVAACPDCGAALKIKDTREIVYRTPFGKLRLRNPRLLICPCQVANSRQSFSPLADVLRARSHPELLYLTTRWASIISYGASRTLLEDVLPIGTAMSCSSIRNAVRQIGQRLDDEAAVEESADPGNERSTSDRAHRVDGTHQLAVTLDSGYIRSNDRSDKGSRWFSATVARLIGHRGCRRVPWICQAEDPLCGRSRRPISQPGRRWG